MKPPSEEMSKQFQSGPATKRGRPVRVLFADWLRLCDAIQCSPDLSPEDVITKIALLMKRKQDIERLLTQKELQDGTWPRV